MAPLTISQTLEPRGPAGALVLTPEQTSRLEADRKTFPVRVTVNGHTFEGRVASMGGELLIGFNKAIRADCGVEIGEVIEATIELDSAPRQVELHPELVSALDDRDGARAAFDALSYSRRKELARGVADAKKSETRERRLAQLLDELA
jgi:hypothetical protein